MKTVKESIKPLNKYTVNFYIRKDDILYGVVIYYQSRYRTDVIDYRDLKEKSSCTISFSGDIKKFPETVLDRYSVSSGQIQDELEEIVLLMPESEEKRLILRLIELWRRYHLNDLIAGTRAQEKYLERYFKGRKRDFFEAEKALKNAGLFFHKGYIYGNLWLCRIITPEMLKKIECEILDIFQKLNNKTITK